MATAETGGSPELCHFCGAKHRQNKLVSRNKYLCTALPALLSLTTLSVCISPYSSHAIPSPLPPRSTNNRGSWVTRFPRFTAPYRRHLFPPVHTEPENGLRHARFPDEASSSVRLASLLPTKKINVDSFHKKKKNRKKKYFIVARETVRRVTVLSAVSGRS